MVNKVNREGKLTRVEGDDDRSSRTALTHWFTTFVYELLERGETNVKGKELISSPLGFLYHFINEFIKANDFYLFYEIKCDESFTSLKFDTIDSECLDNFIFLKYRGAN